MKKSLVFLMFIALIIFIVGCGGPSIDTSNPEALAKSILGTPKEIDNSGITKFSYSETDGAVIEYNFFPLGATSFEKELGVELAEKLKEIYNANDMFNKIQIIAYGPFSDNYGNYQWKPMVCFEVTRNIFAKINWDNFASHKLISIANNVEKFR